MEFPDVEVLTTLTVGGATTLQDTFAVGGATTLRGTLAVGGATTLGDTLAVGGATTLQDTLAVGGDTTLGGRLNVAKSINAAQGIEIQGALQCIPYIAVGWNYPESEIQDFLDKLAKNFKTGVFAITTSTEHPWWVYKNKDGKVFKNHW